MAVVKSLPRFLGKFHQLGHRIISGHLRRRKAILAPKTIAVYRSTHLLVYSIVLTPYFVFVYYAQFLA